MIQKIITEAENNQKIHPLTEVYRKRFEKGEQQCRVEHCKELEYDPKKVFGIEEDEDMDELCRLLQHVSLHD